MLTAPRPDAILILYFRSQSSQYRRSRRWPAILHPTARLELLAAADMCQWYDIIAVIACVDCREPAASHPALYDGRHLHGFKPPTIDKTGIRSRTQLFFQVPQGIGILSKRVTVIRGALRIDHTLPDAKISF